jgi:hypothetical protein
MFTVAPAGMATPFVPLIASDVVAVMLSPIALVFVQTCADDASASVVPAAIVPVRAVLVVPLVEGVVFVGAGVVFLGAVGVDFVPAGRGVTLAGAFVTPPVAVSLSVSFALSWFAIARFAASAESLLSAVESVFDASPEQAAIAIAANAKDVAVIRVYFMWVLRPGV